MMRWSSNDIAFNTKVTEVRAAAHDERLEPGAIFNHLVETVAATLARTGDTSVTVAVTVAILIATVLLGLTTTDAAAIGQFCSRC